MKNLTDIIKEALIKKNTKINHYDFVILQMIGHDYINYHNEARENCLFMVNYLDPENKNCHHLGFVMNVDDGISFLNKCKDKQSCCLYTIKDLSLEDFKKYAKNHKNSYKEDVILLSNKIELEKINP